MSDGAEELISLLIEINRLMALLIDPRPFAFDGLFCDRAKYLAHCASIEDASFETPPQTCPPEIVNPDVDSIILDVLPSLLLEDVIVADFVQPCCAKCQKRVTFEGTRTAPERAVVLEEMVRGDCEITRTVAKSWFLQGYCLRSHSHCTVDIWPGMLRTGKEDIVPLLSGARYEEKSESKLLGPFRFCLVQRPMRSFRHWISLRGSDEDAQLFCSACATKSQKEHCELEFDRIRAARRADQMAWLMEEVLKWEKKRTKQGGCQLRASYRETPSRKHFRGSPPFTKGSHR